MESINDILRNSDRKGTPKGLNLDANHLQTIGNVRKRETKSLETVFSACKCTLISILIIFPRLSAIKYINCRDLVPQNSLKFCLCDDGHYLEDMNMCSKLFNIVSSRFPLL